MTQKDYDARLAVLEAGEGPVLVGARYLHTVADLDVLQKREQENGEDEEEETGVLTATDAGPAATREDLEAVLVAHSEDNAETTRLLREHIGELTLTIRDLSTAVGKLDGRVDGLQTAIAASAKTAAKTAASTPTPPPAPPATPPADTSPAP